MELYIQLTRKLFLNKLELEIANQQLDMKLDITIM